MSSDDSGFDKEAEREKLREKYEQDDRDRENTQRMSELLLQGATMTGKHCDECGDPIFRYDGQEFCPTCQHEAEAGGEAAEESDERASPASDERPSQVTGPTESTETADASEHADRPATDRRPTDRRAADQSADRREGDDEPRVEINDVRVADRHADTSNLRRPPSQTDGDRRSSAEPRRRTDERTPAPRKRTRNGRERAGGERTRDANVHDARQNVRDPDHSHAGDPDERSGAGDLVAARGALVRSLTDLARRAEDTDDVTRARELLAATREAAEALAALDRANR